MPAWPLLHSRSSALDPPTLATSQSTSIARTAPICDDLRSAHAALPFPAVECCAHLGTHRHRGSADPSPTANSCLATLSIIPFVSTFLVTLLVLARMSLARFSLRRSHCKRTSHFAVHCWPVIHFWALDSLSVCILTRLSNGHAAHLFHTRIIACHVFSLPCLSRNDESLVHGYSPLYSPLPEINAPSSNHLMYRQEC